MKYNNYDVVSVGTIPQAKLKKALNGGAIILTAKDLTGNQKLVLHPENAKKVRMAVKSGKGTRINFMPGEIQNDLNFHSQKSGGSVQGEAHRRCPEDPLDHSMSGGSIWSWLKEKAWPVIKKVIGGVGDAVAYANPELAPLREGVRSLTGVGLARKGTKLVKGSPQAKAKMAALRAMRGTKPKGGSFLL